MKLSIIVPAFNAQSCISDCLDDLLKQNIDDYEIIVVNDGSTDDTSKILSVYKEKYPDVFKIIEISNGGQGRARNFALREAKGTYIGFADADDRCSHEMYSKMLNSAFLNDADIVVCDFIRVDEDGEHYEKAAMQSDILSSAGAVWNKLFKNSIIGGVRFSEGLWYEDLCFSAKLLLKSKNTVFINEALYFYKVGHTSTMTNQNSEKNLDIIMVIEDIRKMAEREKPDYSMDFLVINHVLLEGIKRVSKHRTNNRENVIREMRNYVKKSIPKLDCSAAYLQETKNRRIIMKLNYMGLHHISNLILKVK